MHQRLWLERDKIWNSPWGMTSFSSLMNVRHVSMCPLRCERVGAFLCAHFWDALVDGPKISLVTESGTDPPACFLRGYVTSRRAPVCNHTRSSAMLWFPPHLVWSARAWQLKINIGPRPLNLPHECVCVCVCARKERQSCSLVRVAQKHPWVTHKPRPALAASLPGPARRLAGCFFELELLTLTHHSKGTSVPLILSSLHSSPFSCHFLHPCFFVFFFPNCHLLAAWLTTSKKLTISSPAIPGA